MLHHLVPKLASMNQACLWGGTFFFYIIFSILFFFLFFSSSFFLLYGELFYDLILPLFLIAFLRYCLFVWEKINIIYSKIRKRSPQAIHFPWEGLGTLFGAWGVPKRISTERTWAFFSPKSRYAWAPILNSVLNPIPFEWVYSYLFFIYLLPHFFLPFFFFSFSSYSFHPSPLLFRKGITHTLPCKLF